MVSWRRQFFLGAVLVSILGVFMSHGRVAWAEEPMVTSGQVIKPDIHRREVKIADIDTEDFEIGYYAGTMSVEDFGVSQVQGIRVAYHLTEDVFLEAAYGKTETKPSSVERTTLITYVNDRNLSYFNILLGYNLLPGEVYWGEDLAFNTDLYFVIGSGSTKFAGEDRSTLVYGFGYRFLASDWLSIHLDMRRHTFESDIFGEAKKHHNMEVHAGLAVFF